MNKDLEVACGSFGGHEERGLVEDSARQPAEERGEGSAWLLAVEPTLGTVENHHQVF